MSVVTARRIVVRRRGAGGGLPSLRLCAGHPPSGSPAWCETRPRRVEIEVEGSAERARGVSGDLAASAPPLAHIERRREADRSRRAGTPSRSMPVASTARGFSRSHPTWQPVRRVSARCWTPTTDASAIRSRIARTVAPASRSSGTMPYDRPQYDDGGLRHVSRLSRGVRGSRRIVGSTPSRMPAPLAGRGSPSWDADGDPLPGDPLVETRRLLASGHIVAIKGDRRLPSRCDATNEAAVQRLRERKGREAKPLAVMVADEDVARRVCGIATEEWALLASPARPIVLLTERPQAGIARSVARELSQLGLMLPYSPLHYLLWGGDGSCPEAIVLTSGNRSDEPIATDNDDALARLGAIADAFLLHDRPIQTRCDDSVMRMAEGEELPIRRSRGYAPFPVRLPFETRPILACGADLKSTSVRGPRAVRVPLAAHRGPRELRHLRLVPVDGGAHDISCSVFAPRRSLMTCTPRICPRGIARELTRHCRASRSSTTTRMSRRAWPSTG